LPSTISVGEERGFANCPAILAIRTTGNFAPTVNTTHPLQVPQINTKLICKRTLILASIGSYCQPMSMSSEYLGRVGERFSTIPAMEQKLLIQSHFLQFLS
jgi:hypothetical protein